jgi:hypothetical protein
MCKRGFEIAENLKSVADRWLEMQTAKQTAIARITKMASESVPPSTGLTPVDTIFWLRNLAEVYGTRLAPAVGQINDLFREPESKLMDLAAMQGFLEDSLRVQVLPTLEKIRTEIGIGHCDSDKPLKILKSIGQAPPSFKMYPENMLMKVWADVSMYVEHIAPHLGQAKANMARRQKMAGIIRKEIEKNAPAMMEKLGITQDEMNTALHQVGLGSPAAPLVVLIVVLAIGMTAASAAAIYYNGVAKAAADKGIEGVQKIDSAWRAEYEALLKKAKDNSEVIAAETDPTKRETLAQQAQMEMDSDAAAIGQKMSKLTYEVSKDIAEAKPAGLDIGSLAIPALVVGAAVAATQIF